MKAMLIDLSRCVGCYDCQLACKDEHVGNEWMPYAKSQPIAGQFWLKETEEELGTIPKVRVVHMIMPCQHCDDAPCIPACPPGAIVRREDGLVWIDPSKCTGCRNCIDACPYGAIYFNNTLNLAQKCTGCAHLLDQYGWKTTRCADACPTGAITFGDEEELGEAWKNAEFFHPEFNTRPRVRYVGFYKPRIGGLVYDPAKKEVVIGATCTLTGGAGSPVTATTDGFGDFWFKNLEKDTYSVKIEAQGYSAKQIDGIEVDKDVNLGEIPL